VNYIVIQRKGWAELGGELLDMPSIKSLRLCCCKIIEIERIPIKFKTSISVPRSKPDFPRGKLKEIQEQVCRGVPELPAAVHSKSLLSQIFHSQKHRDTKKNLVINPTIRLCMYKRYVI
jgi:hypothetical protein